MNATASDIKRFWSKVIKTPSCWLFGKTNARPTFRYYDIIKQRFITVPAYRFAFAVSNPPLLDEMFVCHRCDNPLCVNPNHLFQGTHTDNMQDMIKKGRGHGQRNRWAKSKILIDNFLSSRFRKD